MNGLREDLRRALRQLTQRTGFALVVVLTLALGIGATTAVFGIVNATMLQPLPFRDADRLLWIKETTPEGMPFSASEPNFLDIREGAGTLDGLAAFRDDNVALTGHGEPLRLTGLAASHDLFDVLGAWPVLGRGFDAAEDAPGADAAVVVLGHRLWQQRFDGRADIIGSDILLDGRAHRVIGVMPAEFTLFDSTHLRPLAANPASDRDDHWLSLVGRLAPGATLLQARAELAAIVAGIAERHPEVAGWGVRVLPLAEQLVGPTFRTGAWLLFAAVGFLLLIACVNLANLWFVRMQSSQREIGVRSALGASRARVMRQLLVEIGLLAAIAVALAIGIAHVLVALVQRLGAGALPRVDEVTVDGRMLLFAIAVGVLATLVCGLLPAWRAARRDAGVTLQRQGRDGLAATERRLRDGLLVGQVALAMLLLVGAGLLLRSFLQLRATDPGFDPAPVLAVQLQLTDAAYREPWQKVVFFHRLAERLDALPGVEQVGATGILPFTGGGFANDVTPEERAAEVGPSGYLQARWRPVTPGFFDTLALPRLRGRTFEASDAWDGPRIVVISATLAEQLWPGEDAVGRRLYWGGVDGEPRTVIGVVGDYEDVALTGRAEPVLFVPYNQLPWPQMTLLVRAAGDPAALTAALRQQIADVDPNLPVPAIERLDDRIAASVAGQRTRATLLAGFATTALLLAAIGIYGVMAWTVDHRRREVGLRLALGAAPAGVLALVLGRGARLLLAGVALGAGAAWLLARLLDRLLYATAPSDPLSFVGAALLLVLVGLFAAWVPARRAARVAPMEVLRQE